MVYVCVWHNDDSSSAATTQPSFSVLSPLFLLTQTLSIEPGYYQDGEFGIRIENVLTVKQVHTPYRFGNIDSLGFEHVTFVPLGSKNLVNLNLLTNEDKLWINQYHQQVRDVGLAVQNAVQQRWDLNW
jgi:hypothetical protein